MNSSHYIKVAVNAPIGDSLTYRFEVDSMSDANLPAPGTSVKVPLGSRKVNGIVVEIESGDKPSYKTKLIQDFPEERPLLPLAHLEWLKWISSYYFYPLGQIAESCFPPLKKKGRKDTSNNLLKNQAQTTSPALMGTQKEAVDKMIQSLGAFSTHLLFGVTGSGKTEVYLNLIEEVLNRGEQAIILVPEIALTPQLVQRFQGRFPNKVAVFHSGLTDREKTDQWWACHNKDKPILVGARSALFCPMENLGLIVVDEEHDGSFKQDEKLKYHGRDAAIMLAKLSRCPVILGSATPSLESWQNALSGKYILHKMPERVSGRQLPIVTTIQMRDERESRKTQTKSDSNPVPDLPFWLSLDLYEKLKHNLEIGMQSALFLNRRGMAQTVQCGECGYVYECPNCAITLTLHNHKHLTCHYCDYGTILKDNCESCKEPGIAPIGLGTELVEQDIARLFPTARLARADRDEISSRKDMEDLIESVENGDVDILIGTQMIAKGLDFPKLNLVGLVLADVGFNMPDFRASERSFQLLTQVSGRSGRHTDEPGQVIIQTYNPTHPAITFSLNADFEGFAKEELEFRKDLLYPPFGRLISFRIQGLHLSKVEQTAGLLFQRAEALKTKKESFADIGILGPAPSPLSRLRGKYRFHLLLKSTKGNKAQYFTKILLGDQKWIPSGTKILVDVDPLNML